MIETNAACPFCGSHSLKVKPVWKTYFFVACLGCKAAGPVAKAEDDAVRLFERRSDPKPIQEAML